MKIRRRIVTAAFLVVLFMVSCNPGWTQTGNENENQDTSLTITKTPFQPAQVTLYTSPGIPAEWRSVIESIPDINLVEERNNATLSFTADDNIEGQLALFSSTLVFAAAVPFMTVDDDITKEELTALWKGNPGEETYQTLILSERTQSILRDQWGANSTQVITVNEDSLLSAVEGAENAVAILPFEEINPQWKILKIGGLSPLDKPFDQEDYPLTFTYRLIVNANESVFTENVAKSFSELLPLTNRDESKMTVIVMSGTTAMARCTASKILLKGTDYPIEMVKDWFLTADLRHVSNEVAFSEECPKSDTCDTTLRLCANPEAIETLEKLGVNVVELTGNHENDYGTESFAETLKMYEERGWYTFGGGSNAETARKPALIESNGNKIAFIGCNPIGYSSAWAKEDSPGAAKCDYDYLYSQIQALKSQGYVVITTFQHNEIYEYMYSETYRIDFQNAVQAGADIVQGSQAHYPMGFELIGNSLIHYGLGNFLFDQMDIPVIGTRREFVDRHIVYNGEYINTELLTALLMDWARPVPMEQEDRVQLLSDIFKASKRRFP